MIVPEEPVEANKEPRKNEMEQALLRGVGSELGNIRSRAASRPMMRQLGGENLSTPEEDLQTLMTAVKKLHVNVNAAVDVLNQGGELNRMPYLAGETYIIDFTHTDYTKEGR